MSTATIKLYDILIEKGVDHTIAREALDEFLTKEEARNTLATKTEMQTLFRVQTMWIAGMLVGQGALIVALQSLLK